MIDKSKENEEQVKKQLEKNMQRYPLCSRVVVTNTVEDFGLFSGMYGTIFSIDNMGNFTVCWDDLTVTTTNYLSYEFMYPNIFSIFTETVPQYYNFVSFLESLRNTFQKYGLYLEGRTEDLSYFDIEKLVAFSIDTIMSETFDGYTFLSIFDKDKILDSNSIKIYDNRNKCAYELSDVLKDVETFKQDINNDDFLNNSLINRIFNVDKYLNILKYLATYITDINASLNEYQNKEA